MKVASKYPMTAPGEQFVMITGNCQKLLFSAVNWDLRVTDCDHSKDAGVICAPKGKYTLTLDNCNFTSSE